MRRQRAMTVSERFFWKHAGFNWDAKHETKAEGRRRCAIALADAHATAARLGWEFEWFNDEFLNHQKEFGYTPQTCECCTLVDNTEPSCYDGHGRPTGGRVLASLGCIDDADANYRRVIEAELALEALAEYDRETEVLDAH